MVNLWFCLKATLGIPFFCKEGGNKVKSKIMRLCPAILVLTLAIAISMSSFAFAGGTAVDRQLNVILSHESGGSINWPDVALGGYFYTSSEEIAVTNSGNVMCDIYMGAMNATFLAGTDWKPQPTYNATPQVNEYNLYWTRVLGGTRLDLGNVTALQQIGEDIAVGLNVTSTLQLRTPALDSTLGSFHIVPRVIAYPHSDEVSPEP